MLSQHSCNFYKYWRENYRWPRKNSRQMSEEKIAELLSQTKVALRDLNSLGKPLLIKIHFWKTQNRGKTTETYAQMLNKNTEIIPNLQKLFSVSRPLSLEYIKELIDNLRVYGANLPVCSAQASFLCNRAIPILDRFVAQFYSLTLSPEILHFSKSNMVDVLRNINTVRFMIEDDGTHRCIPRLAVYGSRNYARNQDLFVFELLPELHRIAKELNDSHVTYQDIYGKLRGFSCVDVEMAVFAFGTQNRGYFQCWYEEQPTRLDLRLSS